MARLPSLKRIARGMRWVAGAETGTATVAQTLLVRLGMLLINVATGIVTARALAPTGRGELAAIILWPQLLTFLLTLGLPAALRYHLRCSPERTPKLLTAAVLLASGAGVAAAVLGIAAVPLLLGQYRPEVERAAQAFMVLAPLMLLFNVLTGALEVLDEFSLANALRALPPLITIVALGVLAFAKGLNPITAAAAYLLPAVPLCLWLLHHLWGRMHSRWQDAMSEIQPLLTYGVRSYGTDFLGAVSGQMDQALIAAFLTPAALGLYTVAFSVVRMLGTVSDPVALVLFSRAAGLGLPHIIELTGRAVRLTLPVMLIGTGLLVVGGPTLLELLYGPSFREAAPVLAILGLEVVIGSTYFILTRTFMAAGRPGTISLTEGVGVATAAGFMLLLIPRFGIVGAAWALLGSAALRFAFLMVCYRIVLKTRPPSLVLTRNDLQLLRERLP
jgi:O-antigen/teichoic acid export membrane protein